MESSKKILFVDDEPMVLSALRRETGEWLEPLGLEFVAAHSVDEALAWLEAGAGDCLVVVSDLKMPQKKGSELLKEVMQRWPLVSTILLTGFSEMEEIKACIRSGIISFIQKPWDSDFLQTEILRGVDLARMRRERQEHLARMEEELSWAKRIHNHILVPTSQLPTQPQTGIASRLQASSANGGDFYRFYPGPDQDLLVCLGNLDTPGVRGTYFALIIRDVLDQIVHRHQAAGTVDPATILGDLNRQLMEARIQLPGVIMNLTVLQIQASQHRVRHACAGGDEFLQVRQGQAVNHHLPSPPLGYKNGLAFHTQSYSHEPGDLLILASQGTRSQRCQTLETVAGSLAPDWPASRLATHVLDQLMSACTDGVPEDATVIVIRG